MSGILPNIHILGNIGHDCGHFQMAYAGGNSEKSFANIIALKILV
jgi:hypothetical protein